MQSTLLGFDYRIAFNSEMLVEQWTTQRRNQYLLRLDVPVPLSVDRIVWPSLFCFENAHDQTSAGIQINPVDFHHQALRLWANQAEMKRSVESANCHQNIGSFVAITLEGENSKDLDERWQMAFEEPTDPTDLDDNWGLIGYDVADKFFTSGLSNCGYGYEDLQKLRVRWQSSLNGSGLFPSIDLANAFKAYADGRIPSHAPFYVFGMYQI